MNEAATRYTHELEYWRKEIDRRTRTGDIVASQARLEAMMDRIQRRISVLDATPTGSRRAMEAEIDGMIWQLARETCRAQLGLQARYGIA